MSAENGTPRREEAIGWPVYLGAIVIVAVLAVLGYEMLETFADLLRKLP